MNISAPLLFSSLANETRLRALMLLEGAGELCVCDLTAALQLGQPHVSRHLGLLREAGLVQDRRAGQWVYYRIHPQLPAWAREVLRQTLAGVAQQALFCEDRRRLAALPGRSEKNYCN